MMILKWAYRSAEVFVSIIVDSNKKKQLEVKVVIKVAIIREVHS
jgi:hypothetical protein